MHFQAFKEHYWGSKACWLCQVKSIRSLFHAELVRAHNMTSKSNSDEKFMWPVARCEALKPGFQASSDVSNALNGDSLARHSQVCPCWYLYEEIFDHWLSLCPKQPAKRECTWVDISGRPFDTPSGEQGIFWKQDRCQPNSHLNDLLFR